MADLDWADVKAIGLFARINCEYSASPVNEALSWHALGLDDRAEMDAIATALREAFDAGVTVGYDRGESAGFTEGWSANVSGTPWGQGDDA